MGILLSASLITTVIMAATWGVYRIFLSGAMSPDYNRRIIMSIYCFSAVSPLLLCLLIALKGMPSGTIDVGLPEVTGISAADAAPAQSSGLSLLLDIYLAGAALVLAGFAVSIIRLFTMILRNGTVNLNGCNVVVHHNHRLAPFSWYRYVFVTRRDMSDPDLSIILAHENGHLSKRHWIDLIIAQIIIILDWYNPVAWIMRAELRDIHEFQADRLVVENGTDMKKYQIFIIKKTVGARFASLANSLNHSSLKKRITMMLSDNRRGKSRLRAIALIPVAAIAVIAMSTDAFAGVLNDLNETQPRYKVTKSFIADNPESASSESTDIILYEAEILPQFPGGEIELLKFLQQNIRYPDEAIEKQIEGKVIVKFIIGTDGQVSNPEILRSVSPELDAEAKRVVMEFPRFSPMKLNGKPVNSSYTLPVSFRLTKNDEELQQ